MVLPHSSTQKYLFTLGGQFAAARGGQYDRLLHLPYEQMLAVRNVAEKARLANVQLKFTESCC